MSHEHRKYVRELKAKSDFSQACFTPAGELESLRGAVFKAQTGADLNKLFFCPFCLMENKLQKFLISTKKGLSNTRGLCPACGEGMLLRSLTRDWTPQTYAQWVFEYARSGFWKKVNFEVWKTRLQECGWSQDFWDVYKQLKAENPTESYEDRMNRQGEEAAQQWNSEGVGQ